MLFLSSEMIKEAEKLTMQEVSSLYLIENAANACFKELCGFNSVRVYCGKGNNGSDGYATALLLKKSGIHVEIVQVFSPANEECAVLCQKATLADIPVTQEVTFPTEEVDCVLDAIFGIGINGEITDARALRAIEIINSSNSYVISADVPSGMNADSGEECGASVKADKTVTFTAPKRGMLSNKSVDLCGEIVVAEVGIRVKYDEIRES
ncbi:MAG: NAD(P)H-hydrate epimerase, partial [Clostridia bacterium]|nr:NAD(P)H-hydrate epimerase [Clostridia bacterium]